MANIEHGDLTVFSLGGASQIDYVTNVDFEFDPDSDDGSSLLSGGERVEITGKGATIRCGLFSTQSNSRVSNLDLTSFSVDGVEYEDYLQSARYRFSVPHGESKGVGLLFRKPQPMPRRHSVVVSATLQVPDDTATANGLRLLSAISVHADREEHSCTFSMVINGVTFAHAATLTKCKIGTERGGFLTVEIELAPRAPISGDFLTDPSGSSSLIEKAINATKTPIAYSFQPHDNAGFGYGYTGNAVISEFEFAVEQGQIIETGFVYLTHGTITGTPT